MHHLLASHDYLTAALPGVGGVFKATPQDFDVEEIPAYEPSGSGDHIFLWIEKTGVSADALVRGVARTLQVASMDIGSAGLKDTRAVTRQYLSVPAACEARLPELQLPGVQVLRSARHGNKLKTGHLRGNRFRLTLRDCHADALARATAIACVLREQGVPNFYGTQRFGRDGETLEIGLQLLRGEPAEGLQRTPAGRRGFLKRLALSSVQSALFNHHLQQRMRDGLLHTALLGEVMQVRASGGPFVVTDVEREQGRFAAREIVAAGPMFGPKMKQAVADALTREEATLAAAGLTLDQFAGFGKILQGTRRANLIFVEDLEVSGSAEALRLQFTLPPGSYATELLREMSKEAVTE